MIRPEHERDYDTGAGDRCVKCGDKSWYADEVCSEPLKANTPDAE